MYRSATPEFMYYHYSFLPLTFWFTFEVHIFAKENDEPH